MKGRKKLKKILLKKRTREKKKRFEWHGTERRGKKAARTEDRSNRILTAIQEEEEGHDGNEDE